VDIFQPHFVDIILVINELPRYNRFMKNAEVETLVYKKDFRVFLERELNQRCKLNESYSLRAFAKSLKTDASLLSKLINGKRVISNKQIDKLGQKLDLNLREIESFKNSNIVNEQDKDIYQLSLDQFDLIVEWQHYAILEMMTLDGFKPDSLWISQNLKIDINEVEKSVERLKKIGLLKVHENGDWEDISQGKSTHILDKNITTYAHKQAQKNILNKAIESLDATVIEKRDQTSMMVTTSPKKIAQAKEMLTQFRRQLTTFLEEAEEKTCVYQMSFSLFPILNLETTITKDKE